MRRLLAIPFLLISACGGSSVVQPAKVSPLCSGGDVPIYRNQFAPQAGASGVATAPEAVAGIISSDAPATGGAVAGPAVDVAAVGASAGGSTTADPAPTPTTPGSTGADDSGAPISAMAMSCGAAACPSDQVAVEVPPTVTSYGATSGGVASSTALPVTGLAASDPATAPPATAPPATAPPASAPPPVATAPAAPPSVVASTGGGGGTFVCADPPPDCPAGQSPQFTSKRAWECTSCDLVVTYGGIYGNYRRCVDRPHIQCDSGTVPTWVFEDEQWECKTKCDNGQYDQHTVDGLLVCVPC
jgi:hypothetical protein